MRYHEAPKPRLYGASHAALYLYERQAHHLQVRGLENVPKIGGAILAISHRDAYDPILAGTAIPRAVFFMAKKELWEEGYDKHIPGLNITVNAGRIAERYGAFPVDRGNMERATLDRCYEIVGNREEGGLLGIFPEQTRFENEELKKLWGRELGPLSPGVASISLRANVPIIAMGIRAHREKNKKGEDRIVRTAAVIKEAIEPLRDPETPRKLATIRTMGVLREVLQEAHDEAHLLAA